jgi:hypothetical protein
MKRGRKLTNFMVDSASIVAITKLCSEWYVEYGGKGKHREGKMMRRGQQNFGNELYAWTIITRGNSVMNGRKGIRQSKYGQKKMESGAGGNRFCIHLADSAPK